MSNATMSSEELGKAIAEARENYERNGNRELNDAKIRIQVAILAAQAKGERALRVFLGEYFATKSAILRWLELAGVKAVSNDSQREPDDTYTLSW